MAKVINELAMCGKVHSCVCEGLFSVKCLGVLFFQNLSFAAASLVVLQHLDLWESHSIIIPYSYVK